MLKNNIPGIIVRTKIDASLATIGSYPIIRKMPSQYNIGILNVIRATRFISIYRLQYIPHIMKFREPKAWLTLVAKVDESPSMIDYISRLFVITPNPYEAWSVAEFFICPKMIVFAMWWAGWNKNWIMGNSPSFPVWIIAVHMLGFSISPD